MHMRDHMEGLLVRPGAYHPVAGLRACLRASHRRLEARGPSNFVAQHGMMAVIAGFTSFARKQALGFGLDFFAWLFCFGLLLRLFAVLAVRCSALVWSALQRCASLPSWYLAVHSPSTTHQPTQQHPPT